MEEPEDFKKLPQNVRAEAVKLLALSELLWPYSEKGGELGDYAAYFARGIYGDLCWLGHPGHATRRALWLMSAVRDIVRDSLLPEHIIEKAKEINLETLEKYGKSEKERIA